MASEDLVWIQYMSHIDHFYIDRMSHTDGAIYSILTLIYLHSEILVGQTVIHSLWIVQIYCDTTSADFVLVFKSLDINE